jgi:hypothetical protein
MLKLQENNKQKCGEIDDVLLIQYKDDIDNLLKCILCLDLTSKEIETMSENIFVKIYKDKN